MNPFDRLRRVVADGDFEALGDAAVSAGLITAEQLLACQRAAAERPDADFRAILIERCGLSPAQLDAVRSKVIAGRYEVRGELGRGGMSIVHRAWDRQLQRDVALKVLRPDRSLSADLVDRMKREALAIARLRHPNLLSLHDIIDVDGLPCLVLEFYGGRSLADEIALRRLSRRALVEVVEKIARAVHHAHELGVIHRDLKPGNVQFDTHGEPHVLDFGLAHLQVGDAGMTRAGASLGTPNYMSPEQVRGASVTVTTDVYGLGATLYEAITGVVPHGAGTVGEIYQKILTEDPVPPRQREAKIHPELEVIALKCLEKSPASRYRTARDLADDLRRFLDGEPIAARPAGIASRLVRRMRRSPTGAAVAVAAMLLGIALASYAAVNAVLSATALRSAVRAAEGFMGEGRWSEADAAWLRAQALDPADSRLAAKRTIAQGMARATDALSRRAALRLQIRLPVAGGSPEERWAMEDVNADLQRRSVLCEQEAEQAALAAFAVDSGLPAARRLLSDLYLERSAEAERREDREETVRMRAQAVRFGGEEVRRRFEAPGTLRVTTQPPGARAYVRRYEERQRRLVVGDSTAIEALPQDAAETEKQRVRAMAPITAANEIAVEAPVLLAPGSYLVVLKLDGYEDVRLPVLIESLATHNAVVPLLRSLPDGFVYVPGGDTIVGGDPGTASWSQESRPRRRVEIGGFIIGRFSVTHGDYGVFAKERGRPRPAGMADAPVHSISLDEAREYAAWCTAKRGGGAWTFRLPTEDEWEKAARGVDGRFFPWGDAVVPAFSATQESLAARAGVEPVGLFPADESPYGVRDLAGVIMNWTETNAGNNQYVVKGGTRIYRAAQCRAARQGFVVPGTRAPSLGFRLAATVTTK